MKNILIIICLFCLSAHIFAQDKLKMELKGTPEPDIYIDGKKYDHDIFELLDQSKIESVNVLKDEQAKKKYNAPNGVIIITTKKAATKRILVEDKEIKIKDTGKDPVIVIDGNVSDKKTLSKLSPKDIESIEVIKGKKAIDQYNALNGVVIIKTNK